MLEEGRLSPTGYGLVRGAILLSMWGSRGLRFLGDGRVGGSGGAHETEATRGGLFGFLGSAARVLVDHVDKSLSNRREIKGMAKRGAC
jgi:hypothetical protein